MKNSIIKILKDDKLKGVEEYNKLLPFLSQAKGPFSTRNYGLSYSQFKHDNLIIEIKQAYKISDLDIRNFKEAEEDENADQNLLSEEEIEKMKSNHLKDADLQKQKVQKPADDVAPELKALYEGLEQNADAKEGLKIRDEYPFLNEKNTPDQYKIAVADKITAWKDYAAAHKALAEGLENNDAEDKIYELAKQAVADFQLNADYKEELDFYKETGKTLGKLDLFKPLKLRDEIYELDKAGLVEMKIKAQKNASKAENEIKSKGKTDSREARVNDWRLREKYATERLENEFK